jgi:peroxygenase
MGDNVGVMRTRAAGQTPYVPSTPPPAAQSGASTVSQGMPIDQVDGKGLGIKPHLETFFDRNRDGKISYLETLTGLRELGLGFATALPAALAITAGTGPKSGGSLLSVNLDGIEKSMHPGDADILDEKGNARSDRIDSFFATHAKKYDDALTLSEILTMVDANVAKDGAGIAQKIGALGEFGLLWKFGANEVRDGERVLTRARLDEFYTDPKLFHTIAAENDARRAERSKTIGGKLQNLFETLIF